MSLIRLYVKHDDVINLWYLFTFNLVRNIWRNKKGIPIRATSWLVRCSALGIPLDVLV